MLTFRCAKSFIKNLNRISKIDYVPELDDLLRVRQPTTAILEYTFKLSETYFMFVDVGGQRSERRKWINCFENVTSILFVASLSDYDLTMSEEELKLSNVNTSLEINRMRDALDLFRTLINWKKKVYINVNRPGKSSNSYQIEAKPLVKETLLFEDVSIILFLNKEDLFEEKFRRSSLKTCFSDYVETDSSAEAKNFIAQKFLNSNISTTREIYYHYTFALDIKNIETVIASVRDRIMVIMLENLRLT